MNTGFKNILRVGIIKSFDYNSQTVSVQMLDQAPSSSMIKCDFPLATWGFYSAPKKNTRVLIGFSYREKPYIVQMLTSSAFSKDLTQSINSSNIALDDVQIPVLKTGEAAITVSPRSQTTFKKSGDIEISFGGGKFYLSADDFSLISSKNKYEVTESGISAHGVIKRDLRVSLGDVAKSQDKLSSPDYEYVLSDIGKNPTKKVALATSGTGSNSITRNAALVESRDITYEFARSYMLGSKDEEKDRVSGKDSSKAWLYQPDMRDQSRVDVLSLNYAVPNLLMEEVKGTLVDRFGNILDLNRSALRFSNVQNDSTGSLEDIYLRRAIKYHVELNSKKDLSKGDPSISAPDGPDVKNGHFHSRWSLDVDGEGLTKVNIPSSSNVGNIPLLSRHLNSALRSGDFKDSFRGDAGQESRSDILQMPFGASAGANINLEEAPPTVKKWVTAYHDVVSTASNTVNAPLNSNLSNALIGGNAGGRSLHANLDGSIELNVGRDEIDHKSIVIDTSGSVVGRFGRDRNGNSIVSQIDGNIAIEVGGDTISNGNTVEAVNNSPSIKLFIKTATGAFDKIEINGDAIVIESAPNKSIVFKSGNNIVLDAAGQTFIGGEIISMYGSADRTGRIISGERLVVRKGEAIT